MVPVIRSGNAQNHPYLYSDAAMQQWNGRWLRERGWQTSLEEIRRFLETWYFHISISGHLYVRPLRQTVTCRDVRAFLRRLDVLGRDRLPETMTFDFRMIFMSPSVWRRITKTLRRYAERINSASLVMFDNPQRGVVALIPRSIGRTQQLSQV